VTALRWGKTDGAYRKYSYIFSKPLPFKLDSNSPISEAAYVRDVIAYAHENDLPGKEWYRKVTVSPQEDNTVLVKAKSGTDLEDVKRYDTNTVFDLLKMLGDETLKDGYRCHTTEPVEEVKTMLEGFEQWDLIELDRHTVQFNLKPQLEASNGK
jgi:hypothetical protein